MQRRENTINKDLLNKSVAVNGVIMVTSPITVLNLSALFAVLVAVTCSTGELFDVVSS